MNIFPLHLLKQAESSYMLVEIKSGDTYSGTLELCDRFMNIKLSNVTQTRKDGERFFKIPEIYIKGSSLKYFQIQGAVLNKAVEETSSYKHAYVSNNKQKDKLKKGKPQKFSGNRGRSEPSRGGSKKVKYN